MIAPAPTREEIYAAAAVEEERIADKQHVEESTDTEADTDAEPAGSGPRGLGPPLQVGSFERRRPLCDGAGLCSVGRWPPLQRPEPQGARPLRLQELGLQGVRRWVAAAGLSEQSMFEALACGSVQEDPIPPEVLADAVESALSLYDDVRDTARPQAEDRQQLVRVRLLRQVLLDIDDPDSNGMLHYCRGVRLGVNTRLPRTPAVFERKRRWRLPQQATAEEHYGDDPVGAWRANYKSVAAHADLIDAQLRDHVARGLAFNLPPEVARARFPQLTVVSLGAVTKVDVPESPDDIRLVMDATHGVTVNERIKPRDQDRSPTAADVKRLQRAQGDARPAIGLAVDVKEAHRLPPVHERDWIHQACRAREGGEVTIYKFGTFGLASSAYWWARLGGAVVRALLRLAPRLAELWVLLMADDMKVESTSSTPHRWILWFVFMLRLFGVPLSWRKVQGGVEIIWIGYSIRLDTLSVGISAGRARWAAEWMRRAARDGAMDVADLRSALGRLTFIANALDYERPFLAPIYAFTALHKGAGVRTLPLYLRLILTFLADRLERRRHYPSAERRQRSEPCRVDAHAEGTSVGVGGWVPHIAADGSIDVSNSRWFSVALTPESAPWAFARGLPYRTIASLEALASLIGVVLLGEPTNHSQDVTLVIGGFSDNRGNKYALSHLQSTKFPLCVVLMELACQLEKRSQRLELSWSPREYNEEADRLSRGDLTGFSPRHRRHINISEYRWEVLNEFLALGQELDEHRRRAQVNRPARGTKTAKRKRVPFKERHPW